MAGNVAHPGDPLLRRAFGILGAFTEARPRLRLSEIAEIADLPRPTTHRIVGQLASEGVLVRDDGRRYSIGRRMWELGLLAPVQTDLRDVASPFLQDLHSTTRATVHLAVRDGVEVLYLDRLSGRTSVPVVSRVGGRLPLYCTGVGKVLLADAPADIREQVLSSLHRHTAYTLTNRAILSTQLAQVLRRGYATTSEEMTLGACSVAVPVRRNDIGLEEGEAVAALGVIVPRLGRDVPRLVAAMEVAARGIARSLPRPHQD
jgi:DNA-binding IclR family transcriptional regulator